MASFAALTAKPVPGMIELLPAICTPCDTPAASIQIVPNACVPPMAASIVIAPGERSSKFLAAPDPSLLMAARSIVAAVPLVTIATPPVSVIAPAMAILPPAMMSPARRLVPIPDWVNAPPEIKSPVVAVVRIPEWFRLAAPTTRIVPETSMSPAETIVSAPIAPSMNGWVMAAPGSPI